MSFFSFQDIICCTTGILVMITMLLAMELVNRRLEASDQTPAATQQADQGGDAKDLLDQIDRLRNEINQTPVPAKQPFNISQREIDELRQEIARLKEVYDNWDKVLRESRGRLAQLLAKLADVEGQKRDAEATLAELRKKEEIAALVSKLPFPATSDSGKRTQYVEFAKDRILVWDLTPKGPRTIDSFPGADCTDKFLAWAEQCDPKKEWFAILVRPEGVGNYRNVADRLAKFELALSVYPPSREFFEARR
jgi:hypothetical protein